MIINQKNNKKKHLLKIITFLILITCILVEKLDAKIRNTFSFPKTKSYTKKAPYFGYGKRSSVNSKIKTKAVKGYFQPSRGYKFVNPYARSK